MTDARMEDPQDDQLTEEELQKDSMFMHWREHHARASQAYKEENIERSESLCEEMIMQPWGVPRIYQAEAHAMLATMGHREDCVERALAAREQYRRIFLANRNNPTSELLYRNAHSFVRTVQKDCGMTELSPLYENRDSVAESSQTAPSISIASEVSESFPSLAPSESDGTAATPTEAGTPIVSPASSFGPSTPGTEPFTSAIAEAPMTVKKRKSQKFGRAPVAQLFSDTLQPTQPFSDISQPTTTLPSRPIALPRHDVAARIAEEEDKRTGRASSERKQESLIAQGTFRKLGTPKKEVAFSTSSNTGKSLGSPKKEESGASSSTGKTLGSPVKLTKKKSYRDALRDVYEGDKKA